MSEIVDHIIVTVDTHPLSDEELTNIECDDASWNGVPVGKLGAFQQNSRLLLAEVKRLRAYQATVPTRIHVATQALRRQLAEREGTLDLIVYKCADYDAALSQAESMSDEPMPWMRGRYEAGTEINRIIEASGYVAKDRPEDE